MLSLIDRWLLKEVVKTLLVILAVLFAVLMASTLVRLLGKVAGGLLGNDVLLILVGLELLKELGVLVPPAFFFAVLWVLGRLYRDGEMLALHAAGVGTARIYRAFMFSALPLALLVAWLSLEVLPWAKQSALQITQADRDRTELAAIRPGGFSEFAGGELVLFAEREGINGELRGLFVQDRLQDTPGIVTASAAKQVVDPDTGARYVVLVNGHRYQGLGGKQAVAVGEFAEYGFVVPEPSIAVADLPASGLGWRELLASEDPEFQAELQARLSSALAVLAFALVAVPLARSTPRQSPYGRLGVAILIYIVYMNLQHLGKQWLASGAAPAWLGLWWVPGGLAAAAALVVLFDSPRWRLWLRRRRASA